MTGFASVVAVSVAVVGAVVGHAQAAPTGNAAPIGNAASDTNPARRADTRATSDVVSEQAAADAARARRRSARKLLVELQFTSRHAFDGGLAPVSELSLPHGLTDPGDGAGVFVQAGMLFSNRAGQPTVFPMQLGIEYEPWRRAVSPFLDVSGGGYLVVGRGRGRQEASPVDWLWGSCASAGLKLYAEPVIGVPVIVRGFGQAFWSEAAFVPLAAIFSGWSFGFGLEYQFGVPDVPLIRKVSHGDGMPEGW